MSKKTAIELTSQAQVIRDELAQEGNTKQRIYDMFKNLIDSYLHQDEIKEELFNAELTFDVHKKLRTKNVDAAIAYSIAAGGHEAGNIIEDELIADGIAGHVPDFSAAEFSVWDNNYNNTAGVSNYVWMRYMENGKVLVQVTYAA